MFINYSGFGHRHLIGQLLRTAAFHKLRIVTYKSKASSRTTFSWMFHGPIVSHHSIRSFTKRRAQGLCLQVSSPQVRRSVCVLPKVLVQNFGNLTDSLLFFNPNDKIRLNLTQIAILSRTPVEEKGTPDSSSSRTSLPKLKWLGVIT